MRGRALGRTQCPAHALVDVDHAGMDRERRVKGVCRVTVAASLGGCEGAAMWPGVHGRWWWWGASDNHMLGRHQEHQASPSPSSIRIKHFGHVLLHPIQPPITLPSGSTIIGSRTCAPGPAAAPHAWPRRQYRPPRPRWSNWRCLSACPCYCRIPSTGPPCSPRSQCCRTESQS